MDYHSFSVEEQISIPRPIYRENCDLFCNIGGAVIRWTLLRV